MLLVGLAAHNTFRWSDDCQSCCR